MSAPQQALAAGGAHVISVSGSNNDISVFYATNIQTSPTPLDKTVSAFGNSSSPTATTASLATTGELVVGWAACNGGTLTQVSGWSSPPDTVSVHNSEVGGNQIPGTSIGKTYNPALSVSCPWGVVIATFKHSGTAAVTNVGNNQSTGGSVVQSGTIPAGSLIVVAVANSGSLAGATVTDSVGNTYAQAVTVAVNNDAATNGAVSLFYCYNCLAL